MERQDLYRVDYGFPRDLEEAVPGMRYGEEGHQKMGTEGRER